MRAIAVIALLALPSAARAADCAPPALKSQVQMRPIAVGDSQIDAVPVIINGTQTEFLFDTGGVTSQISAGLAEKLQIPINRTGDELVDAAGRSAAGMTMIREFRIGSLSRYDVPLPLSPDPVIQTGIISLNDLTSYDADVDFSLNILKLFSQNSCPGGAAGGTTAAVIPFSMKDGHITVTVQLDGKDIAAIVDTGSTETNLRADIAKDGFGLVLGGPDTPANGHLEDKAELVTYGHAFKSLAFGNIAQADPQITIIPDKAEENGKTINLGGPELILGMNVLRKLHIYFAFQENKIYVSQAPGP